MVETDTLSKKVLSNIAAVVADMDNLTEQSLAEGLYKAAQDEGMDPKDMFTLIYTALIGKEKGPRLAGFIMTAGKEKILPILEKYKQ